jgi:hypothetical protein
MFDDTEHTVQSVVNYLAKYLRKGLFENSAGLKKRRIWSAVNFPAAVNVRDILLISRWKVVHDRFSVNGEFCCLSFSTRAKISAESFRVLIGRNLHNKQPWDATNTNRPGRQPMNHRPNSGGFQQLRF